MISGGSVLLNAARVRQHVADDVATVVVQKRHHVHTLVLAQKESEGLNDDHDQQGRERLARGAGRRRGDDDCTPRPAPSPLPCAQHQGPVIPSEGPGQDAQIAET